MKVSLREKKISGGRRSLYLDFYPPIISPETGKPTRREFLNLYIFERPKTDPEKIQNRDTKQLADNIRAKRQIEIQSGAYGFQYAANKRKDFLAYFHNLVEKRKGSSGNYDNWQCAYNYLKAFTNGSCIFGEVDERFCSDFRDYLLSAKSHRSEKAKLSPNSAQSYFNKFKAVLTQAFDEKLIAENPAKRVKPIKQTETQREFLTFEELQALADTECEIPELKRAAIFSALTGLRWSDILKLVWSEVQSSDANGYYIRFRQKKTKGEETLPISEDSFRILGERGEPNENIFKGLQYSAWLNAKLLQWVAKADINITYPIFKTKKRLE
jgi:integrase